ncbi:MAG: SIS domain-containing protein, partial [Clostridiaceae bacterium]|nr:SIS domain-containing protein [Clostridiaceae bacterium]
MTEKYIKLLSVYLNKLKIEESNLNAAAKLMADAIKNDRLIHIFGTDPHSASIGDEMFCKGGGLVNINPFYDPAFSLAHGGYRCSLCQTLDGLAPVIMEYYENVRVGDPIIIIGSRPDKLILTQAVDKA